MTSLIETWTKNVRDTWGLEVFQVESPSIRREVSSINTTEYRLGMEWFPPESEREEDMNPPGTIYTEVNLTHGFLTSLIIVQSEDHRKNPPSLPGTQVHNVINWITSQTGLQNQVDFILQSEKREDGLIEYHFSAIVQGYKVSPGGWIEVKIDEQGHIVFYSLSGFFPRLYPEIQIKPADEQRNIHRAEVAEKHMVLFGSLEEDQYRLFYGIDENFIENHEDELVLHWSDGQVAELVYSDEGLGERWNEFRESQIISEEEMKKDIPHPDTIPVSLNEKNHFIKMVTTYFKKHRPKESGNWKLKSLKRENGDLLGEVIPVEISDAFLDKYKFVYDSKKSLVVEILDKRKMFGAWIDLDSLKLTVSKQKAVDLLMDDIIFEPFFVFDHDQNEMQLKHRIDCHQFVDAATGKKVILYS